MIEVELYQPGGIKKVILFPQEWNELSTAELEEVSKSILSDKNNTHEAKALLFASLLFLRSGLKNIAERLSAEDAVLNGYPLINFIFDGNGLTKQPYEKLAVPNRMVPCKPYRTVGPADDFDSITCGEFEDCEIYFNQFKEDPKAEHLVALAATLYRPAGTPYMSFQASTNTWQTYDAEAYFPYFRKLKPWVLYTIFLWYSGCRSTLPGIFPNCFGGGSKAAENDPPDYMVFTRCIHAGAGPKNGTRNDIRCTKLKEFMFDVELENEKAIEQAKQFKNG